LFSSINIIYEIEVKYDEKKYTIKLKDQEKVVIFDSESETFYFNLKIRSNIIHFNINNEQTNFEYETKLSNIQKIIFQGNEVSFKSINFEHETIKKKVLFEKETYYEKSYALFFIKGIKYEENEKLKKFIYIVKNKGFKIYILQEKHCNH
jgi:hypothetical protein